ncbi:MAG: hypothetical protein ACLFUU_13640 [Desulfobacteraceae bacterium]
MVNYSLAGLLVLLISFIFVSARPATLHWFMLPATACGLLTGADLVRWLRGEIDPFDPKGLVGLILFHGWFLAPLLHVYWGQYGYDLNLSLDPRTWLGVAALVNLGGIVCYKVSQRWAFRRTAEVSTSWKLISGRLFIFLIIAIIVGLIAQAVFYQKYFAALRLDETMRGTGWLLMLGDSLPTLLALGIIASTPSPQRRRTWILVGMILLALATLQFFWSGLRGSRSAFVGVMFFSTCLIHFWWRRLQVIHLLMALALLLPFMYYYGFYKGAGSEAVKAFESPKERQRLEQQTGRTFPGMVLGDLARADVQARISQEIATGENEYRWRLGRTYLKALSQLIPYSIWKIVIGDLSFKERWNKAFAFAELNSGRVKQPGFYPKSSRVYGLSGEAMLNFGFWGVAPVWLLYGLIMGWVRRKLYTLPRHDARWLLMPIVISLTMGIPTADLDNLVFGAFKGGLMVFLLVLVCSRRLNENRPEG